jgi:two-component system chemotaxis response regulator CheB
MNVSRVPRDVVAIGASAGGIEGLRVLLAALPQDFPAAIAAVIHRSPLHVSHLAQTLSQRSHLPVLDASDGDPVQIGRVYLAPPDLHLRVEDSCFRLLRTPKIHFTRPAVDPLFESAAAAYGSRVVGVLLSGGGDDGVSGLTAIKAAGGLSIVQHPDEAPHPWMPANAIAFDHVDAVLPLEEIAAVLSSLARGCAVDLAPQAESALRPATPRPGFSAARGDRPA